ncbi:MAG: hypothetical protein D6689_07455 [Deltaproteobacteria bacterium]|nr:MAG: hypothetical protein D6689_07455 [Deltaproteobacteria bacterium]
MIGTLSACGGITFEPADDVLEVPADSLAAVAPPGDSPWGTEEAHAGAARAVDNTVPWYPDALRDVSLPERVLSNRLGPTRVDFLTRRPQPTRVELLTPPGPRPG